VCIIRKEAREEEGVVRVECVWELVVAAEWQII
jgi:hypothetical protein